MKSIRFELIPEQFSLSFNAILSHFSTQFLDNPALFIAQLLGFSFVLLVTRIMAFSIAKKSSSHPIAPFVSALGYFIFALLTFIALEYEPTNPLFIIFNLLSLTLLILEVLKIPLRFYHKSSLLFVVVTTLVIISSGVTFFAQLTETLSPKMYMEQRSLYTFLTISTRLLAGSSFIIYIGIFLPSLLQRLGYHLSRQVHFIALMALVAVLFPWVFGVLNISPLVFLLIFLLGLCIGFYGYISHTFSTLGMAFLGRLYPQELYDELEYKQLAYHTRQFMVMSLIMAYSAFFSIIVSSKFSKFYEVIVQLTLVKTTLFTLTLTALLAALVWGFGLYSLLFLSIKRLRASKWLKSSETIRSVEALIHNFGILGIIAFVVLVAGVSWQVMVPIAGALGIGLGFGLQTILNNYVSGFIMLASKKIKIGDTIELAGQAGQGIGNTAPTIMGQVQAIDVMTTIVRTADGIDISIPNSQFLSDKIINYTYGSPYVRMRVPVGVSYKSNPHEVEKLIYEAIEEAHDIVRDKDYGVNFSGYGASSLDFIAMYWVDMRNTRPLSAIKTEFLTILLEKFRVHGIEIPFPQQDIWIRNGDEKSLLKEK